MKTRQCYRIAGSCIVLFALILLATPAIRAADGIIPANVTIGEIPVSVEGIGLLEFGELTPPLYSEAIWLLSPVDGSLVLYSGDPTSTDAMVNDHNPGRFRILGTAGSSVNFTVEVTIDFADPQLSLGVVADLPSPSSLDGNGQLDVRIGGVLQMLPGAASGLHEAIVTMIANY